ncbi:RICIN domain-containing protein [Streptomyces sp. NPDC020597]|uniref:RICIN domain-containing protein n=1 Tax=unclassified Streptomyces TaxID=2593676 RepID=UPI0037B505B7
MARRLLTPLTPLTPLLLALAAGQPSASAAAFTDPVKTQEGADPWISYRVRVVNQSTGKVADVASCSTADAAEVRQWTWLNSTCRQWKLSPARDPDLS